ncbi:MAG: hypothetical protein EZS28_043971, partial [Streblomastix strix]
TQQSNLLVPPAPSSTGHPAFQSSFQSQNLEQPSQQPTIRPPTLRQQQQNQAREPTYVNGRLLDSPGTALTRRIAQDSQPLWNNEIPQRTDQSLFTPVDPPELTINMSQQQFNAHRDFWAQISYSLRYIGLRADGTHHRGFGEGLMNVSIFIQRHARHEHLTVNEWKAFWRELDTDLYLDTVRMELDEDDNNHHHHDHDHDHDHNHRHDRERNGRDDQLDLGRGRKIRRVISSDGSGNGQNNDDWAEGLQREIRRQQLRQFRIRRNRGEQILPPVQTVSGAPVYLPGLRAVQEEAFRVANRITPNLDEESSRQEIEVIDLEQNTQENIENIPMNEQRDTNNGNQQPTQIGATHTPQTEAPDNLQHQQVGQIDDLNNIAEQNPFQQTQNFPELLNLTHQTSLSETGSLNEQQQQLSLSLSPSSSSSITQNEQRQ